jgi:hypothetical protein
MMTRTIAAMMMACIPMLGHGQETIAAPLPILPGLSNHDGILTLRGQPYFGMGDTDQCAAKSPPPTLK